MMSTNGVHAELEGCEVVSVMTQILALVKHTSITRTVLKQKYLPFYKFDRPHIRFNL